MTDAEKIDKIKEFHKIHLENVPNKRPYYMQYDVGDISYILAHNDTLSKQLAEANAKLANRHIIGKVYEVSAESINRLAGELDDAKAEVECLKDRMQILANDLHMQYQQDLANSVPKEKVLRLVERIEMARLSADTLRDTRMIINDALAEYRASLGEK